MNPRAKEREAMGLSQTEAAWQAGLSLATWRRWERDPESVRRKTRESCERVLDRENAMKRELAQWNRDFELSWGDDYNLTPRQAASIAATLGLWNDEINFWVGSADREPLHDIGPFHYFDLRVMCYVGDNRAWAAKVAERCIALSNELRHGKLPFDGDDDSYMDEVLVGVAIDAARDYLHDDPEAFADISAREVADPDDEDGSPAVDSDWGGVASYFDNECLWDDWMAPTATDSMMLSLVLRYRHPFTWFDRIPTTTMPVTSMDRLCQAVMDGMPEFQNRSGDIRPAATPHQDGETEK